MSALATISARVHCARGRHYYQLDREGVFRCVKPGCVHAVDPSKTTTKDA